MKTTQKTSKLAVYIHWPWCKSKCPYCDFNSHAAQEFPEDVYIQALLHDLKEQAKTVGNRQIISIYFGGGTPSLISPQSIEKIIGKISELFIFAKNIEISMEANPTSSSLNQLKAFKAAGINRISIGVQSLVDSELKFLGREHNTAQAINTIENAVKTFSNVSLDLIYALPSQSLKSWENSLKTAIKLGTSHISAYQLTIEPSTVFFGEVNKGKWQPMPDDRQADFINKTNELLKKHRFNNYEISNYAKQGNNCIHNQHIWQYGDFLGIGAGAHGRFTDKDGQHIFTQNYKMPQQYMEKTLISSNNSEKTDGSIGGKRSSEISNYMFLRQATDLKQRAEESLLMGLRLKDGFKPEPDFQQFYDQKQLKFLAKNGLLHTKNGVFRATSSGKLLLNSILSKILTSP